METIKQTALKVKQIKIQGANAISLASLNTLKKYLISKKQVNNQLTIKLLKAIGILKAARPTEPFLFNILDILEKKIKINQQQNIRQFKKEIIKFIGYLIELIKKNNFNIAKYGENVIRNNIKVLTHCHSSTIEQILITAKQHHKKFTVYNTETRPLFQGRITAKNLLAKDIPVTMITDSAAGFVISKDSGEELMMDLVIIGADSLLPDGSVINKIGSYNIGLASYYTKVPLYIASTLLKYDSRHLIPLELREEAEIWPTRPKKLKIINLSFDRLPAKFITGIITEVGIIKPSQIKQKVKKYYPWLLN